MGDADSSVTTLPEGAPEPGAIAGYTPPDTVDTGYKDYFDFKVTEQVMLPDGHSWVEIKKLNEGERSKYQNEVNRDVRIKKNTGDASIRTAPGDERRVLLECAIIGWNLQRNGKPVPFSKDSRGSTLSQFLDNTDPVICDIIEKAVRRANPWLLTDMTVEEIDKEIDDLKDMRRTLIEQEEGKASSSDN